MTATSILLSAVVNIRLCWGQWLAMFTEISLGFAAGLFVLGAFAPRGRGGSTPSTYDIYVGACLPLSIIGAPLLMNAVALAWIPEWAGKYGALALLAALVAPIFVCPQLLEKEIKRQAVEDSPELTEWSDFEQGLLAAEENR